MALPASVDACGELHNDPVYICMYVYTHDYILFMLALLNADYM